MVLILLMILMVVLSPLIAPYGSLGMAIKMSMMRMRVLSSLPP